jgi:hypothetical protein
MYWALLRVVLLHEQGKSCVGGPSIAFKPSTPPRLDTRLHPKTLRDKVQTWLKTNCILAFPLLPATVLRQMTVAIAVTVAGAAQRAAHCHCCCQRSHADASFIQVGARAAAVAGGNRPRQVDQPGALIVQPGGGGGRSSAGVALLAG